jgi:hypothetical protein
MGFLQNIKRTFRPSEIDTTEDLPSALTRLESLLECTSGDDFCARRNTKEFLHVAGNGVSMSVVRYAGNTRYLLDGNITAELVRDLLHRFFDPSADFCDAYNWIKV